MVALPEYKLLCPMRSEFVHEGLISSSGCTPYGQVVVTSIVRIVTGDYGVQKRVAKVMIVGA